MKEIIKQKRHTHIVESAERVFFSKGYSETNISDICKMAECSRTTLYSYFESKENMYLAVVNRSFELFLQYFSNYNITGVNGRDRILSICRGYINFSKKSPRNYQTILDFYTILNNANNGDLKTASLNLITNCIQFDAVRKNARLPFELMVKEIKVGKEDKSITSQMEPQVLFLNIWAYLIGISNLSKSSKQKDTILILDLEMKDWEENAIAVIKAMMA